MTEKSPDSVALAAREVLERTREAAARAGRNPADVSVLAAVKQTVRAQVEAAVSAGIRLLGENRVQEMLGREEALPEGCEVHFIGHLQTNKVRQAVERVSLIQSVDRLSLAREIERCAAQRNRIMPVLIEINIGGEEGKSGVAPDTAAELSAQVALLPHLRVRGLMTIPPIAGEKETEGYFDAMRRRFLDIGCQNIDNVHMEILSMGMSRDYPLAVKHGSSLIRIGSAIFGERL